MLLLISILDEFKMLVSGEAKASVEKFLGEDRTFEEYTHVSKMTPHVFTVALDNLYIQLFIVIKLAPTREVSHSLYILTKPFFDVCIIFF